MKTARFISALSSTLLLMLIMVVGSGCSKKCDDQAQPADNTQNAGDSRSFGGVTNNADNVRPTGGITRDAEFGSDGPNGPEDDSISDDGDDEADGEGSNKKGH
ncbi:MAG: hypothetical protein IPP33_07125 [Flavobacteriales bacterium]|nr:hypothetical protein [Flavobacteriales bacterium]